MAVHRGAVVIYVTNAGAVPAVTTKHYTGSSEADVAASSADKADLVLLGYSNTRLTSISKSGTAGTYANRSSHTAGTWYVPS